MTSVEIRVLGTDDTAAWIRVRLESLERDPQAFGASVEAHRKLSDDEVKSRLAADMSNKFVIGAFADGILVGTVGFVREPGLKERHKGRVWGVYLRADYRGQGIGHRMMASLLEYARKIDGLEQIALKRGDSANRGSGVVPVIRVHFFRTRAARVEGERPVYR